MTSRHNALGATRRVVVLGAIVSLCAGWARVSHGQSVFQSGAILVEHTGLVSSDAPRTPHAESFLAINPKNSDEMIASAITSGRPDITAAVYISRDRGSTWHRCSAHKSGIPSPTGGDPVVSYDGLGHALFTALDPLRVWRASRGCYWNSVTVVPGTAADREYVTTVPNISSQAAQIYVAATMTVKEMNGPGYPVLGIARSDDNGISFLPATLWDAPNHAFGGIADILPTSDGSLLVPFYGAVIGGTIAPTAGAPRQFWTAMLTNEGSTIASTHPGLRIGHGPPGFRRIKTLDNIRAAIDLSGGPHTNRIYVTWVDYAHDRYDVNLAYSDNRGLSWSLPVTLNDNTGRDDPSNAAVAVNRFGVVAVIWNDRRDDPNNECYTPYVTASTDGGQTFLRNVRIAPKTTCTNAAGNWIDNIYSDATGTYMTGVPDRFPNGGETQGLAATPDGAFHIAWIYGASGVTQLYYSSFVVKGTSRTKLREASSEPQASSGDVTPEVQIKAGNPSIDFAKRSLTFSVTLENRSRLPLALPLTLTLTSIYSALGDLTALNSDNKLPGKGAQWVFSDPGARSLGPGHSCEKRTLEWAFDGKIPSEPPTPPFNAVFRVTAQ